MGKKGVVLVPDRTISSAKFRDLRKNFAMTILMMMMMRRKQRRPLLKQAFRRRQHRRVTKTGFVFQQARRRRRHHPKGFLFWWCRTGTKGPPKVVSSSPKKERGTQKMNKKKLFGNKKTKQNPKLLEHVGLSVLRERPLLCEEKHFSPLFFFKSSSSSFPKHYHYQSRVYQSKSSRVTSRTLLLPSIDSFLS